MIVTQRDARRIIAQAYPGMPFRLTKASTIGVRPVADPRPTLAWRKIDAGKDSGVYIGVMLPNCDIDWGYAP